jgi:N-acetyl-anhydromuramyl-L-alanine amidase AmpD/outer membrane protein assembly factor BamB/predicted phosphodiesterase
VWTLAAGTAQADEFDEIRAMADPERVSPEAFTAPGHFQPSPDLAIVPLPSEHFTPVGEDRSVDTVILHFTSGRYVEPDDPYPVDLNWKIFNFYRVSSHFMISRDGAIFQLVRESDRAWHAGGSKMPAPDNREGVNDFSIGIEVIGIHGEAYTDAQYESVIALVRDIRQRHAVPLTNVLGHEHIAGERAVSLGLRRSAKVDPGPSFDWRRVMEGVAAVTRPEEPTRAEGVVSGTVYRDVNGNGVRDEGEAGWPGAGVSDGVSIALTDDQGRYRLEASAEAMELVFVIQPAFCRLSPDFFRRVKDIEDQSAVDFGLVPAPRSTGPLTFAQVSDVHVGRREDFARFLDALQEVDNHPAPIDFIIATGDLVNRGGRDEQLETYAEVAARAERPWMHCFGNHDSDEGSGGTTWYRQFLGPDFYSFDRGECHFVVRNSIFVTDVMERWIEEDIRLFGGGKTLIVLQHYPPTEAEQYRQLADMGVRAVISGHWHSTRVVPFEQMLSINTPTFMMGAIDVSPSGFRLVTVDDETVTTRFIYGRTGRVLTVQSPAERLEVIAPVEEVWSVAHDSESDVTSAEYEITGPLGASGESWRGALEKVSPLAWMADVAPAIRTPGSHRVTVRGTDGRGDSWSESQAFAVLDSRHREGIYPSDTPWLQHMGGPAHLGQTELSFETPMRVEWIASSGVSIDFGSPVTDRERVYVGLRNRDNAEHNGVAAHDIRTGNRVWFAPTQTAITHTVATDGERVYASDHGGRVYGLDCETGEVAWTYDLGDSTLRWVYAAPCLFEANLICGSSKYLANLDPSTGEERWAIEPGGEFISSYASPAVADGVVVIGGVWQRFNGERVHSIAAYALEDGEMLWAARSYGLHGSPTIFEGRVHTMDIQGKFRVHDLHTGELLWQRDLGGGWATTTPAIDPGSGTLVTAGGDGLIHAFDLGEEREIWRFQTGESRFRMSSYQPGFQSVVGPPLIAGDRVFLGSADGHLRALDLRTGEEIWGHDFGVPTLSAPCPSGDRLLVTALDGNLVCLRSGRGPQAR